jgi:hypothetical protein
LRLFQRFVEYKSLMSKLLTDPISQSDIEEYLKDYSDFSFELNVLNELQNLGLMCQHGGTYNDPLTGKKVVNSIFEQFINTGLLKFI